MIRFFKWFNSKVETSTLWFAGYCFVLRIFYDKFFHSISDQTFYTITIVIFIVFSFIISKSTLRLYKDRFPNYKIFRATLNIVYFVGSPIALFYFLIYNPLLGSIFGMILFIIIGLIYMACDIYKKREQA